jgi:hypothetical protein
VSGLLGIRRDERRARVPRLEVLDDRARAGHHPVLLTEERELAASAGSVGVEHVEKRRLVHDLGMDAL